MHQEVRTVPYPALLMYHVVSDVEKYPLFLPWVVGLRVTSRLHHVLVAEMLVGYHAFREKYTSRVDLDPVALRVDVTQIAGPFKTLENHWHFTPKGDSTCEVDFSIAFEFRNRVLAAVAARSFEKALLRMTTAFEARAKILSEGIC